MVKNHFLSWLLLMCTSSFVSALDDFTKLLKADKIENPQDSVSSLATAILNYQNLQEVKRYKKIELGVQLPKDILIRVDRYLSKQGKFKDEINPFLEWDLDVEAIFYHPKTGLYKVVDGFYYRDFVEDTQNNFWKEIPTDYQMRVRYAPVENGFWECTITIKVGGVLAHSSEKMSFDVIESGDPGYVKVHPNKRNLMRGDSMIFPVGHNFVAPYEDDGAHYNHYNAEGSDWFSPTETHKATSYSAWQNYKNRVKSYMDQGGKFIRTGQIPASSLIEFEKKGNYYDRLHYAWEQDKIYDLCEERDVLVSFNLLFHEPLMNFGNYHFYDWDWDKYDNLGKHYPNDPFPVYCYNDNPGVKKPHDMFLNKSDIEYHKQRTRYYISRYGYSTKIYEFELISETFHLNEFWKGTEKKPYDDVNHPDHDNVRKALYNYHSEISGYIKNTLLHDEHLIGICTQASDWTPDNQSLIDSSAKIKTIDIVGINPYYAFPYDFLNSKPSSNPTSLNGKGENSWFKRSTYFWNEFQKPLVFSEGGPSELYNNCSNYSDFHVSVMTFGFTGCAGFNMWSGFTNPESFLWKSTIRASEFMNSDDVIRTLSIGYGDWVQGRQKEGVNRNEEPIKENQYFVASNKEQAVGYVRNRSYNIQTSLGLEACDLNLRIPYGTKQDVNWDDGPKSSVLKVEKLKRNKFYEITWYSFKEGLLLSSDCQKSSLGGKLDLKHPTLKLVNGEQPILWYVIHQKECRK